METVACSLTRSIVPRGAFGSRAACAVRVRDVVIVSVVLVIFSLACSQKSRMSFFLCCFVSILLLLLLLLLVPALPMLMPVLALAPALALALAPVEPVSSGDGGLELEFRSD